MRPTLVTATLILSAAACTAGEPSTSSDPPRADCQTCNALPAPPCVDELGAMEWDEPWRAGLVTALGEPVHSASDAVVRPGEPFALRGKFAYGPTSKDLEGETVGAFLRTDSSDGCDGWQLVGTAVTDSDGRAAIGGDMHLLPGPGRHDVRFVVRGDRSTARAAVTLVAPGTRAAVFDIDGTLTASDIEIVDGALLRTVGSTSDLLIDLAGSPLDREQLVWAFDQILDEDASMHDAATDVVRHRANEGMLPVFLTGRPYLFDDLTRDWLERHEFPASPLFLSDSVEDAMPGTDGVERYKRERLVELRERVGLDLAVGYGNATTDICAYAAAGLDPRRTFIIGPHAGEACPGHAASQPVDDYPSHLASLGE